MADMTGAEFRVTRERLGLTGEWLAKELGVTDRTLRRWETGAHPIPDAAVEDLQWIVSQTNKHMELLLDQVRAMPVPYIETYQSDAAYKAHEPWTPWPASWHRAVAGRVAHIVLGARICYRGQ